MRGVGRACKAQGYQDLLIRVSNAQVHPLLVDGETLCCSCPPPSRTSDTAAGVNSNPCGSSRTFIDFGADESYLVRYN